MKEGLLKRIVSIGSLALFVILLILLLVWLTTDFYMKDHGVEVLFHLAEPHQSGAVLDEAYDLCENDDDRLYCLNRFYSETFNYTRKGVNIMSHDFDDYVDNGINCGGAAMFYVHLLRKMEIPAWVKAIHSEDTTHLFVITMVDDSYCIVDQKEMECYPLALGKG